MNKKEANKYLWKAIENTTKTIKALDNNPVTKYLVTQLWSYVEIWQKSIQALPNISIITGKFYSTKDFNNSTLIVRAGDIEPTNHSVSLCIPFYVLTCSNNTFEYIEVNDILRKSILDIGLFKEIEVKPEDLPLYINNPFKGKIFSEIFKN